MLVLRRKVGEAIVLNGVITVYVLAVEGERVKLGINAPPDVVIVRQELLDSVAQENRARKQEQQAGEGSEQGTKRSHEPPPEGSGRRDLRAMLDRALSTPDGTLPVPQNGHSTEAQSNMTPLRSVQPQPSWSEDSEGGQGKNEQQKRS